MRKLLTALLVGFILLFGVSLLHLGPLNIKAGEDRVLASLSLTNNDKLYLVAHKTGHLIDAYEVQLYRVNKDTNFFVAFLGHEESYWWGASLRPVPATDKVEVFALGGTQAIYSIQDGSYDYPSKNWVSYPSYHIDGTKVTWRVPQVIRKAVAH